MAYIVTIAVSVASAMLAFLLQSQIKENRELKRKQEKQHEKHQRGIEEGVLCLLREMLIQSHAKYTKKGSISSKSLESGLAMYNAYKMLGGNGMVDHMKDEIEELPIIDD